MNIEQLIELHERLSQELAAVSKQIKQLKQAKQQKALDHIRDQRGKIVERILNGENISDVAASLGRSTSAVQNRLHRHCSRANPVVYYAGIKDPWPYEQANNYLTPPLQYLRENKSKFLKTP